MGGHVRFQAIHLADGGAEDTSAHARSASKFTRFVGVGPVDAYPWRRTLGCARPLRQDTYSANSEGRNLIADAVEILIIIDENVAVFVNSNSVDRNGVVPVKGERENSRAILISIEIKIKITYMNTSDISANLTKRLK